MMKEKVIICLLLTATGILTSCGQAQKEEKRENGDIAVGGPCEDCELIHAGMPAENELKWSADIADASEPGKRIEISGVIYQPDGKTPAPGIILYIYQTDNTGHYTPADTQTLGRKHGHLRGWIKTSEKGEYKFTTIRPAPYPDHKDEEHIHAEIKEPGKTEYWIDSFVFEDDPLLDDSKRKKLQKRGGSGIIALHENENGILTGKRDIILGLNVSDYR